MFTFLVLLLLSLQPSLIRILILKAIVIMMMMMRRARGFDHQLHPGEMYRNGKVACSEAGTEEQ